MNQPVSRQLPADPPTTAKAQRARIGLYVSAALVLLVAGGVWLGWQQLQGLQQQLREQRHRAQKAEDRADAAALRADAYATSAARAEDRSQAAALRADTSEASAERAEEGTLQALRRAKDNAARRQAAEQERDSAQADAKLARQQAARAAEQASAARAETASVRAEREREIARLQGALGRIAQTQRTALGLVMNLGQDAINFDFDKADLKPSERELLSRIAGVLMTSNGYRIQVFGHTDDVGDAGYNQRLSERRAEAVANYLIESGIDPSIVVTKGFGKAKPLVQETTDSARARNRRVELGIIDTVVNYTTEPSPSRRQR